MQLVRSHRFIFVQVPQVVMNIVYPYGGRSFARLVPIVQSINLGGARREAASED